MKAGWIWVLTLGLVFCCGDLSAADADVEPGSGAGGREGESVEAQLDAAVKAAEASNVKLIQAQHAFAYEDEVSADLHKAIKALEKELLEKRKTFNDLMMKDPGIRQLMKDRDAAFRSVRDLKERLHGKREREPVRGQRENDADSKR